MQLNGKQFSFLLSILRSKNTFVSSRLTAFFVEQRWDIKKNPHCSQNTCKGRVWENWPLIIWIAPGAWKAHPVPELLSGDQVHTERKRVNICMRGKQQVRGFLGKEERVEMKSSRAACLIWGLFFSDSVAWRRNKDSGFFVRRFPISNFRDLRLIWD